MENTDLAQTLEGIGFTAGEAKVYLALLEIGESKVGPLIRKSHISRSKVYDILDRLITKSVISKIEKKGVLFYQALPANSLLNFIKNKEKKLKLEENMLQKVLPVLASLRPKQKVNVMIYEGFDGFKAMIDRTLEELTRSDCYEAMGISQTTEAMRHYARKIYDRQKTKKFLARSIFDEQGAYKIKERKNPWHEIRILPSGWNTPALFTIYGEVVGIHLGEEESIVSIVIQNKHIAKSFRATFEAMWKISKKV